MNFKRTILECAATSLLLFPVLASAQIIEFKEDAVIEMQTKSLTNSGQAKDIGEDWNNDQLNIIYSNIDFTLKILEHKFNASWFLRHSNSDLYQDDRLALNYHLFPRKVIARDLFRTQYIHETQTTRTESILNKFTYEFGDEDFYFKLGRMYVNYGEGYMANPLNPFNLPQFSGTHAKFNQGNDGMQVKIQNDDKLILKIYVFQDRSYREYHDEKLTRTFMLHGDWQYKPDTNVQYVLGEDQKRHKYGLQVKKTIEKGMGYFQVVRFSQKLDQQEAYEKGLTHYILGGEYQVSDKLTTRLEIGKQEFSENLDEANHLSTTFIPMNKFAALINSYQHSDKHKTVFLYARDGETKFAIAKAEHNYAPKDNHDVFVRVLVPITKTDGEDSLGTLQRTLATEATFGIRLFY